MLRPWLGPPLAVLRICDMLCRPTSGLVGGVTRRPTYVT